MVADWDEIPGGVLGMLSQCDGHSLSCLSVIAYCALNHRQSFCCVFLFGFGFGFF